MAMDSRQLLALVIGIGVLLPAPARAVACDQHGCRYELEDLLPCAEVIAIVECEVGGVSIADCRVLDSLRGPPAGERFRLFRLAPGPGQSTFPQVMLPGTRLLLAGTTRFNRSNPLVRAYHSLPSTAPEISVLELASQAVGATRGAWANTPPERLLAEVKGFLSRPSMQRSFKRAQATFEEQLGCSLPSSVKLPPSWGRACARRGSARSVDDLVALVPEDSQSGVRDLVRSRGREYPGACRELSWTHDPSAEHAFVGATKEPPPSGLDGFASEATVSECFARGKYSRPSQPYRAFDISCFEKARQALRVPAEEKAARLKILDGSSHPAARAAAAVVIIQDGNLAGGKARLQALDAEGAPERFAVALELARRGDLAAMDALMPLAAHGSYRGLGHLWREALVLLANSAYAQGLRPCGEHRANRARVEQPRCLPPMYEEQRWVKLWEQQRDTIQLTDAWPFLSDVPYWGF